MGCLVDRILLKALFSGALQQHPCRVRVADGGLLIDTEDERQVQWVGAVGETLFDLALDAEPFKGGGEVAGSPGGSEFAFGAELDGRLRDQQVGVGRVRPAVAAVVDARARPPAPSVSVCSNSCADTGARNSSRLRTTAGAPAIGTATQRRSGVRVGCRRLRGAAWAS